MKRFILATILTLSALSLSACGNVSRTTAAWTGYDQTCVDGVAYLQFTSGATVKYDRNGNVVTC